MFSLAHNNGISEHFASLPYVCTHTHGNTHAYTNPFKSKYVLHGILVSWTVDDWGYVKQSSLTIPAQHLRSRIPTMLGYGKLLQQFLFLCCSTKTQSFSTKMCVCACRCSCVPLFHFMPEISFRQSMITS